MTICNSLQVPEKQTCEKWQVRNEALWLGAEFSGKSN